MRNRPNDQIRKIKITRDYLRHPYGSVLIELGDTKVICTASVEERVPPFLAGTGSGWLTAEYSMLPGSTMTRKRRAIMKQDGRSMEIQRLIGRSLRSAIDLEKLGEVTIYIDCDVIQADGGTRTASITGAFVALRDAVTKLMEEGVVTEDPILANVAAVSVGILGEEVLLDLDYPEDSAARVDMNVVMNENFEFIEVQGTGEESTFSMDELLKMMDYAKKGIEEMIICQKEAAQ